MECKGKGADGSAHIAQEMQKSYSLRSHIGIQFRRSDGTRCVSGASRWRGQVEQMSERKGGGWQEGCGGRRAVAENRRGEMDEKKRRES